MKTTSIISAGLILFSLVSCGKAKQKQMTLAPESSPAFQKADEGLRCELVTPQERKEIYLKLETKNQITSATFLEFGADGEPSNRAPKINGLRLTRLVGTTSATETIVKGNMLQETALSVSDDKAILLTEVPVTLSFKTRSTMEGTLTKETFKKGKKNKVTQVENVADIINCESAETKTL